jgi:D-glycero-D-manno-heptose 1,7-bisphosphate phosphatase
VNPQLYIFDADDTLRRTLVAGQPCPRAPDEWKLIDGVRERLGRIDWGPAGPYLGIASNQDQVGFGLVSAAMARRLLEAMVAAAVGPITPAACIRLCPHLPESRCACRKPAPGMLLHIMGHFGVPARRTLFVGNAESDRQAAMNAGTAYLHRERFFAG